MSSYPGPQADYSEIHTTDDGRITVYPNALRPCTDCGEPIGTDAGSWNGPGQGLRHSTCPQAAERAPNLS